MGCDGQAFREDRQFSEENGGSVDGNDTPPGARQRYRVHAEPGSQVDGQAAPVHDLSQVGQASASASISALGWRKRAFEFPILIGGKPTDKCVL